jgi:L-fuconolactonase
MVRYLVSSRIFDLPFKSNPVWLASTPERPWRADGIGQAHILQPFSYYELLARMDEAGVDRVVIVPPSWEGYHNEYAMEVVKQFFVQR